jgi:hypothetical protein
VVTTILSDRGHRFKMCETYDTSSDLSVAENYVWVAAERVPLSQVDPRTNRVIRQFVGGKRDDTMRVGFGSAWIVDELHGQIWRVDLAKLNQLQ